MVDQGDEDGSTPLIAAAWTNQVEVVDFLLSKNANIDWANKTVSGYGKHGRVLAVW